MQRMLRRAFSTAPSRAFSTASSRIGFVGAGNMGAGMVASLARAGFRVDQYDRSPEALAASVAQSDLIEAAPDLGSVAHGVTIVSVAGEAAERAVLLGPGGVLESSAEDSLVITCGTITVDFAREVHAAAAARGVRFLDAPVSGGPEGAAKGTLSIMCGGDASTFADATPVLEGMW